MLWFVGMAVVAFVAALLVVSGFAKSKKAAHLMLDEYRKLLAEAREERARELVEKVSEEEKREEQELPPLSSHVEPAALDSDKSKD